MSAVEATIRTIHKMLSEIENTTCSPVKKHLMAQVLNFMLNDPIAVSLVENHVNIRNVIVEKAVNLERYCSEEDEEDIYDNENRSILIACSKFIKRYGGTA